jgi:hypothetical protein
MKKFQRHEMKMSPAMLAATGKTAADTQKALNFTRVLPAAFIT